MSVYVLVFKMFYPDRFAKHEKAIVEKQIKPKTTLIVPVKSNVVSNQS